MTWWSSLTANFQLVVDKVTVIVDPRPTVITLPLSASPSATWVGPNVVGDAGEVTVVVGAVVCAVVGALAAVEVVGDIVVVVDARLLNAVDVEDVDDVVADAERE